MMFFLRRIGITTVNSALRRPVRQVPEERLCFLVVSLQIESCANDPLKGRSGI